jgi:Fe-S cluster assembly ATP-binding protein
LSFPQSFPPQSLADPSDTLWTDPTRRLSESGNLTEIFLITKELTNMILTIRDLNASVADIQILKGINLTIREGEVHAIMGPNGSGKSTLAKALAGDPKVEISSGTVVYQDKNLLDMAPEERALAGVFMAFQYPVEIPGVNNAGFLRMAYNAKRKARDEEEVDPLEFDQFIREKLKIADIPPDFLERSVNHGFSGGEKKRNEILQMAVLEPTLAVLDETDSGLDVDALRIVAKGVNQLRRKDNAIILVTHYQRLLNYIAPDFVHILSNGQIIKSGDKTLAIEVENKGYDWLLPCSEETIVHAKKDLP